MALPLSRSTTYAASSQVKSADLNDIQDSIVQGAHGDVTRWLPMHAILTGVAATPEDNVIGITNPSYFYLVGGNNCRYRVWLPLDEGERLKAVYFHFYDNDANASLAGSVNSHSAHTDGAAPPTDTSEGNITTAAGSSANLQIKSVTGLSVTASATKSISVSVSMAGTPANAQDLRCYGIRYTVDRPLT